MRSERERLLAMNERRNHLYDSEVCQVFLQADDGFSDRYSLVESVLVQVVATMELKKNPPAEISDFTNW